MTDTSTDTTDQPDDEERIDAIVAGRRASRRPGGDPNSTDTVDQARAARRNRTTR